MPSTKSPESVSTLVRLSFWAPPERQGELAACLESQVRPLMHRHGFAYAGVPQRPQIEGIVSRLFAVDSPEAVLKRQKALFADATWQALLDQLGKLCGAGDDGLIRYRLGLYRAGIGAGKTVEAGPGIRQGLWQTFNGQDGLPATTVRAIFQDRDDNLWLCSNGGVCRYDGALLTNFDTADGLVDSNVDCIAEDDLGRLWFGTRGKGVSCLDGQTFEHFTVEDGLADDWVGTVAVDDEGRLWFGGSKGVSWFDGHSFQILATASVAKDRERDPVSVLWDSARRLWFNTESRADYFDGGRIVRSEAVDGGPEVTRFLGEDRRGGIWFAGESSVYRQEGTRPIRVDALEGKRLRAGLVDRRGDWWFATESQGVWRYDGKDWHTYTSLDGLANDQVLCITEDRQGVLWFGTLGGGVSRYDASMETFSHKDGLPSNGVMCIVEDRRGDLWFGTWEGVGRYDGEHFSALEPMAGTNVWSALEDRRGVLWFGILDKKYSWSLARFHEGEFASFGLNEGLAHPFILRLAESRRGDLWCCTGERLQAFGDGRFRPPGQTGRPLDSAVKNMYEDRRGRIWLVELEEGPVGGEMRLWCFFEGRLELVAAGEEVLGQGVWRIYEDRRGRLWFGTIGRGVYCYDGEGPLSGEGLAHFTAVDGLVNDCVYAILEDDKGHMWFGTFGGGISRYDGLVFQTLSKKDGLPHDTIQYLHQDRRGAVWIATEGGVARYRPRQVPVSVRLTDVVADRHYGPPREEVRLSVLQELVRIEFLGISFTTSAERIVYVYRLNGRHADWRVTRARQVEYQNLPEGSYTFEVRAVDRDLNYSSPARFNVTVEPDPFREGLAGVLSGNEQFIGTSQGLQQVQVQLEKVAQTDWTVLIRGETGTGKGLAARALHRLSGRRDQPFIPVNCGAIPEGLVESELFGHERGAFTGAVSRRLGKVELAGGGTLFLDEVGDMPMGVQVKLLRFLEEHAFERVGGEETLPVDVRVVAATNRDLEQAMAAGRFRSDLFYRLSVFAVDLPPLRQRREDVVALVEHFVHRFAHHLSRPVPRLSPVVMGHLQAYAWPGNVRELEHLVQRAVLLCRADTIELEDLGMGREERPPTDRDGGFVSLEAYRSDLLDQERHYIEKALEATGGTIHGPNGAARLLQLHPERLRSRMRTLGMGSFGSSRKQ